MAPGDVLVTQGDPGHDLFLLLDGVLAVDVDGAVVAEVGPGAVLSERSLLEGGRRTATLRGVTRCRLTVVDASRLSHGQLTEVAAGHRREKVGRQDSAGR
ncbi:MAG: cyclic nucleotide-binding domain-containing protein [Candidatus Dormibacteria bacterium]